MTKQISKPKWCWNTGGAAAQVLLVLVHTSFCANDFVNRPNFGARRLMPPRVFKLGGDCGLVSPDRHPKERYWRTTLVTLVISMYFDDDRCHIEHIVVARLAHDEFFTHRRSTTRDTTAFCPPTHELVIFSTGGEERGRLAPGAPTSSTCLEFHSRP